MSDCHILLVEDDQNLGFVVKDNLEEAGYEVDWCEDGALAQGRFSLKPFDLCIVDVMLPKVDGFSLVEEFRKKNEQIPILFLTAKSMEEDKLKGFQMGADDYITKPFSMEELLMRIKVFLKRNQVNYPPAAPSEPVPLGIFQFDYHEHMLSNGQTKHKLTQREADLLQLFVENTDVVLKREEILKRVWGQNDYFLGRSLDVFISRLRKHLKADPAISITNYHRVGFKFSLETASR